MRCPRCDSEQGYKQKIDFFSWFICPACEFKCYLKHYRAELKNMAKTNCEKLNEWISHADAKEICEIFNFDVWQQAHDQINFGTISEQEAEEILDDIESSKIN